jgi:hypothetical protein
VYDEVVLNGTDITLDKYYNPAATVHVTTVGPQFDAEGGTSL